MKTKAAAIAWMKQCGVNVGMLYQFAGSAKWHACSPDSANFKDICEHGAVGASVGLALAVGAVEFF